MSCPIRRKEQKRLCPGRWKRLAKGRRRTWAWRLRASGLSVCRYPLIVREKRGAPSNAPSVNESALPLKTPHGILNHWKWVQPLCISRAENTACFRSGRRTHGLPGEGKFLPRAPAQKPSTLVSSLLPLLRVGDGAHELHQMGGAR